MRKYVPPAGLGVEKVPADSLWDCQEGGASGSVDRRIVAVRGT
jgi:hypothetical protein